MQNMWSNMSTWKTPYSYSNEQSKNEYACTVNFGRRGEIIVNPPPRNEETMQENNNSLPSPSIFCSAFAQRRDRIRNKNKPVPDWRNPHRRVVRTCNTEFVSARLHLFQSNNGYREFNGDCFHCGCYGHSKNRCPLIQCKKCFEYGHSERICGSAVANDLTKRNSYRGHPWKETLPKSDSNTCRNPFI